MEPRENETKHNKEKAENKHVEKSLKTGTAKRKSTNVEEMRGEKESRNMPEFTAGEAKMLQKYADTLTSSGEWLQTFGAQNLLGCCQEISYYRGSLGVLGKCIGFSSICDF